MRQEPVRGRDATVEVELDHRLVRCPAGVSVLRAAELNGVFIPSLCSHKDLSAFGGCRLCVVEIAGMRGYPLACSTTVQQGMSVLTDTTALRETRREILELILSEHPSSCLVCTEALACRENVHTIRKAGVTTGCRYCPNDGQCELAALVEKLGVTDIHYPIDYRGYEPEHDDPFFDRDYNLCILCGRCVRMCQEVRGTSVLAFNHRGPKTRIGPAFGRSHVEAGCEFCGACVSVCPTGTLADKVSKWDGRPDGFEVSTCPFCPLGCQIELHHRGGRLSKALPHLDPEINDGQLCVRGRFCLPETTHNPERARKPVLKRGRYFREVSWPEALDEVASRLRGVAPDELLMLVSPDLTNESLHAARRFVRSCLLSNGIDSTARWSFPGGPGLWADLFSLPISVRDVGRAEALIAIGLDSRFSFSVAGVEIRRALRAGATLVTIDPRDSNLSRYTRHALRPLAGREGVVFRLLAEALLGRARGAPLASALEGTGVDPQAFERAAAALAPDATLAVVVGPTAFALDSGHEIAHALLRLGRRERTTVLPLYQGANARGLLELGVFAELHAGLEGPAAASGLSLDALLQGRSKPKVLYLVGESPFFERPDCDFLIAQDTYAPPFDVDAFLPAASFAESEGTLTNVEGRVQRIVKVEDLPDGAATGCARPDWHIFDALAEKLGRGGPPSREASLVLREIAEVVPRFPASADRAPRKLDLETRAPWEPPRANSPGPADVRLVLEPGGFRHRGIDLSFAVEGLSELRLEEGFRLHPEELSERGIETGEDVVVAVDGLEVRAPARADPDCPRGAVYAYRPFAFGGIPDRKPMDALYRLEGSLFRASVRRAVPAETGAGTATIEHGKAGA